jgi:hypothetical protein
MSEILGSEAAGMRFLGRWLRGALFPRLRVGPASNDPLVLVTGANKSHARSLVQLLTSVRAFEPDLFVVVYDLGLTRSQRRLARRAFPCRLETFDFARYPPHLNIKVSRGQYAWKPTIVDEVARKYGGWVCWMDAGNVLISDLSSLRSHVREHGFYSPSSDKTVADWTHPGMLSWFGLGSDWDGLGKQNLNGACVCFDTRNAGAAALLSEWARLALVEECIAPPGSSRKNHRQDQALLSVLAHRSGRSDVPAEENLGFRTHADIG